MVLRTVSAKNRFLWLGLLLSCIAFMHAITAFAGTKTLAWDASMTNTDGTPITDLEGYKIYYGPTPGNYTNALGVGNVTTSEVINLTDGLTYYFAVTAYNSAGVESSFSNEVSTALPSPQFTLTTTSTTTASVTTTPTITATVTTTPKTTASVTTSSTITASADIGGTITPAGATAVNDGANQTITDASYVTSCTSSEYGGFCIISIANGDGTSTYEYNLNQDCSDYGNPYGCCDGPGSGSCDTETRTVGTAHSVNEILSCNGGGSVKVLEVAGNGAITSAEIYSQGCTIQRGDHTRKK